MRMIAPVVNVLVNDCADSLWFKESASKRFAGQQSFAQEGLHRSAEPIADGNAKAHFSARQILPGNELFQDLLEDVLSRQAAQLHLFRQARGKLHQMVIKKGRTRFQ